MLKSQYLVTNGILFALSILLALVEGYDCNLASSGCSQGGSNDLIGYSICMVRQYSVSVFIQCASQKDVPNLTTQDDDGQVSQISPIKALTNAMTQPACSTCNLAHNIQKAANEHGSDDFATYLCNHYHPVNAGLCCLRNCLLGMPNERSIQAFCSDNKGDLMNEPLQPESCGSSDDSSDTSSDDSSDTSSDDSSDDSSAAASSTDSSSSTEPTSSRSPSPTQSSSSAISTTTSAVDSPTPTSGTSTLPVASQATATASAASISQMTSSAHLVVLGLAVLPMLAVLYVAI